MAAQQDQANERVEDVLKGKLGKYGQGRYLLAIGGLAVAVAILAVLLWPSADPADAVPPEPTPDVDAMIQQALAAAVTPTPEPTPTLTPTPTLQPPNLLPITVSGYTEYRFLHFLAEYRNCFGGELLANVDPALEPTPELLLLEPTPIPEAGGEPTPTPTPTPAPVLQSEAQTEIETLLNLPVAVSALLASYDRGDCVEPQQYAIYQGRGKWLRQWQ